MEGEWVLIQLDEDVAKKHGIPLRVPAPKGEFEGIADAGFELPKLKKWIGAFLSVAPAAWRAEHAALAKSYERFVAKADFWQRGLEALGKRDMAGAISAFKMVSNVDPDDHAAKMNLGLAYAETGDAAQARKMLLAVRDTYAGDVDYHMALGQTTLTLGDKDGAADEFALALETSPDHMPALRALAGLGLLVAVYEDPRDAASLVFVQPNAVLESVSQAWAEAPRDGAYYLAQLDYHASEGRHDVALAAAERALEAGGTGVVARAERGRVDALRGAGKLDEALARASGAIEAHPGELSLRVSRARVHFAAGREDEGRLDVAAVLDADPGNLEALALRFPLEHTLTDASAERLALLTKWAGNHPDSAGAAMWLGLLQSKAGAEDSALESLERATRLAPDDDAVLSAYFTELGRAGKWEAVVAAAGALDMKSRDWKVRWTEAEAHAALGRKVEARAAYAAINADEKLPLEVRKRAKRAAERVGGP